MHLYGVAIGKHTFALNKAMHADSDGMRAPFAKNKFGRVCTNCVAELGKSPTLTRRGLSRSFFYIKPLPRNKDMDSN
jgi:hypothetical protein